MQEAESEGDYDYYCDVVRELLYHHCLEKLVKYPSIAALEPWRLRQNWLLRIFRTSVPDERPKMKC